ncbi:hypothetical protein C1646_781542 [Rhizophagus diaphanus]|nr:hypothetical protein C1646_781542 [Rhizophagus diaphanus] [Rhizophagus sp. MUCL 43196]
MKRQCQVVIERNRERIPLLIYLIFISLESTNFKLFRMSIFFFLTIFLPCNPVKLFAKRIFIEDFQHIIFIILIIFFATVYYSVVNK